MDMSSDAYFTVLILLQLTVAHLHNITLSRRTTTDDRA